MLFKTSVTARELLALLEEKQGLVVTEGFFGIASPGFTYARYTKEELLAMDKSKEIKGLHFWVRRKDKTEAYHAKRAMQIASIHKKFNARQGKAI